MLATLQHTWWCWLHGTQGLCNLFLKDAPSVSAGHTGSASLLHTCMAWKDYMLQTHLQREINVAPETKFNYRYTEYNWKLLLKCPAPILHTDKNLYFCGLTSSTMINKVKKIISMQLRLLSIKSFLSRCSAKLFWTNSSSLCHSSTCDDTKICAYVYTSTKICAAHSSSLPKHIHLTMAFTVPRCHYKQIILTLHSDIMLINYAYNNQIWSNDCECKHH